MVPSPTEAKNTTISVEDRERWEYFFKYVFGNSAGWVCISRRAMGTKVFVEEYFQYPQQIPDMLSYLERFYLGYDLYFCPQILKFPQRKKERVLECPSAWADLDTCQPSQVTVRPTIIVESSPNRFQAYWLFEEPLAPADAEDLSRRIAYAHADDGADKSGWDLTQLLRVPFTHNYKYGGTGVAPIVKILTADKTKYTSLKEFEEYPQVSDFAYSDIPYPVEVPNGDDIIMKYRNQLHPMAFMLFSQPPKDDWSKALWQLEMLLLESGLSREEVFGVCRDAACNKYERDERSQVLLWKEVCKASFQIENALYEKSKFSKSSILPLLTDEERELAIQDKTIVEEYIEWASSLGDAAPQYHEAGIFIVLASVLAGHIRLPTSFGTILPNLWFMILADTTLTRKTTSMDIAMDLLGEVDPDAVLATDGSIEGLFYAISTRPGKPSVFLRDEFSGLLEMMVKKEYYAGMAETLTKLYDGKFQKRILRRDTIEVHDPVLILFAGGIKNRTLSLLNYEHVASGFLPRFIFITAEADLERLQPLGPPTTKSSKERERLRERLSELAQYYNKMEEVNIVGTTSLVKKIFKAELTDDAWVRYNQFETAMLKAGMESENREVFTPSFDRLSKSGLKAAILIAASREVKEKIVVEERDIIKAIYFVERWRDYGLEVLLNIGKTAFEKIIDQAIAYLKPHPNGLNRANLMRLLHLSSRNAEELLATMDQRGLITRVVNGKSQTIVLNEGVYNGQK